MGNIVFARPRHDYGSYRDYWRLITLSGYPLVYFDEVDLDSDDCVIFSTPQADFWTNFQAPHKCRIIYYDLEHYPDFDPRRVPRDIELWSSDPTYAKVMNIKYVMMGSDCRLAGYETSEGGWGDTTLSTGLKYDAILLAHMTYRRQVVAGEMVKRGLEVAPNEGLHGVDRHDMLKQTHAMIHVHQRDHYQAIAPQRFALAAAYKMPLISETVPEKGLYNHTHVLYSSYGVIADMAWSWLRRNDKNIIDSYGQALHQLLCVEWTFKKSIEAAL